MSGGTGKTETTATAETGTRGMWLSRGGFAHYVLDGDTGALCGASSAAMLPAETACRCCHCVRLKGMLEA